MTFAHYSIPVLRASRDSVYNPPILSLKELTVNRSRYDDWLASLPVAERQRRARWIVRNLAFLPTVCEYRA